MFTHISSDERISVQETSSGYIISLLEDDCWPTGEIRNMGANALVEYTANDYQVSREDQFRKYIDVNTSDLIDAYFG